MKRRGKKGEETRGSHKVRRQKRAAGVKGRASCKGGILLLREREKVAERPDEGEEELRRKSQSVI